jgi:hypothetical protein
LRKLKRGRSGVGSGEEIPEGLVTTASLSYAIAISYSTMSLIILLYIFAALNTQN